MKLSTSDELKLNVFDVSSFKITEISSDWGGSLTGRTSKINSEKVFKILSETITLIVSWP